MPYTLCYFHARGRAELSRMILKQAGVPFEDKRVTGEEWVKLKPTTLFGSMPFLEIDGQEVIAQSQAVARYLAREFGLVGSSNLEQAKADEAAECVCDLIQDLYKAVFAGTDAEKEEKMKNLVENLFPVHQGKFEKILSRNKTNSGFLVGGKVTYADLALYAALDYFPNIPFSEPLKNNRAKVAALPNIAKWLKERPETQF